MKLRTFVFPPTPEGRQDFRLAFDTLFARDPSKCTKDERQYVAQFQRALEAVGERMGEVNPESELDTRKLKLREDGGAITITQRLHEKVCTYIEETVFMPSISAQVEDFRDRWGQAEKSEGETVPHTKATED